MNDEDIMKLKQAVDKFDLSNLEKATLCGIVGGWFTQLHQAEALSFLVKGMWEKLR